MKKATTPRQLQTLIRLTAAERAALRRLAQRNGRSMSRQVAALISDAEIWIKTSPEQAK